MPDRKPKVHATTKSPSIRKCLLATFARLVCCRGLVGVRNGSGGTSSGLLADGGRSHEVSYTSFRIVQAERVNPTQELAQFKQLCGSLLFTVQFGLAVPSRLAAAPIIQTARDRLQLLVANSPKLTISCRLCRLESCNVSCWSAENPENITKRLTRMAGNSSLHS